MSLLARWEVCQAGQLRVSAPPPQARRHVESQRRHIPREHPAWHRSAHGGYGYNDPGRTRFSAAVKKIVPLTAAQLTDPTLVARREAMGHSTDNVYHRSAIVALWA
ncbi:hypothetical protein C8J57DRAFT_1528695 [Mycena rebaudengoi]|nr:hypothetical protein C8J57DRAFT_1528695 [Mycena rebaudengoi]